MYADGAPKSNRRLSGWRAAFCAQMLANATISTPPPPAHSSRGRLYRARSQCPIRVSPDPASSAAPISPYSTYRSTYMGRKTTTTR